MRGRQNKDLSSAAYRFSSKLESKYMFSLVDRKVTRLVYSLKNLDGSNAGTWHIKDLKISLGPEDVCKNETNSTDCEVRDLDH